MIQKYTITCDYSATGEGRTIFVLYCAASSLENAIEQFKQEFRGGDYFAAGIKLTEGYDFENYIAQTLVTEYVQEKLQENYMSSFAATLHYNYG
jgi:hypothetical protein